MSPPHTNMEKGVVELEKYLREGHEIEVVLQPIEAYAILVNLQIALELPGSRDRRGDLVCEFCQRLIAAIEPDNDTPLHALCMAGFDDNIVYTEVLRKEGDG